MFIEEQSREYNGTDHVYNADSFNEMTPPSSDPSYLASSSKSILSSMQAADPEAIWLMQGWLFQDSSFWKPTQMKALLTGKCIFYDFNSSNIRSKHMVAVLEA